MQFPHIWKTNPSHSKLPFVVLFFTLSFICFNIGLRYSKNGYKKPTTTKILPTIANFRPTISLPMVGQMGVVPVDSKHVSYRKENAIYLRDIVNNRLSPEIKIAASANPINHYQISPNFNYVVYTYFSNTIPEGIQDMSGSGDEVVLKDIITGTSKTILSNLTINNLAASLSFDNNSRKLFIGLDNEDIYSYSLAEELLTKVYSGSKTKTGTFCQGYNVVDMSPNGNNLIVNSRCYEGTTYFLYNISSKTFTKIGGGYVEGIQIIKFLHDNEIYGFSYGENTEKYLKINLWGGIIQELPKPTDLPKPFFGLYDDYQTHERFIAEESKSRVPNNVDDNSRQVIGINAEDIFFYSSP